MSKNKRESIKRIIFALILLMFFIPAFILGQMESFIAKSVSMSIYSLAGMLVLYELLNSLKFNKIIAILSTICVPIFFILPWSQFDVVLGLKDPSILKEVSLNWISHSAIGAWEMWVFIFVFSFLPLLLQSLKFKVNNYWKKQIIITLIFSLICAFSKLFWAYNSKSFVTILFFIMISVLSDTFGYFGGMFFGKKLFNGKKLAPKISPKKTWAGFVIGTFLSMIFAIVGGYFMHIWRFNINNKNTIELVLSIVMGVVLPIISALGDLFFSYVKRKIGIKDFSNLIPGHGGLLDRVDSQCFVFLFTGMVLIFV